MIDTIYIEDDVADHPRTKNIVARFPKARTIPCERYGEVFNRRAQNFRLQKKNPALILARKFDNFILPAPKEYGIGGTHNFYFSHMLNCLYDCRYCFLQGMFQSAHYLMFVNYEDFKEAIAKKASEVRGEPIYFYSGYDCDSLAMDSMTGFVDEFLPSMAKIENAWLELRTKSVQTKSLLDRQPHERCVVAFSMTPSSIASALEDGAPPVESRLGAMKELGERGWPIGLRFDPLIYHQNYQDDYRELFAEVFREIKSEWIHSVSLGPFRLPRAIAKTMTGLYPEELLFAGPLEDVDGMVSYRGDLEREIVTFCTDELLQHIDPKVFFPCQ